MDLKYLVFEELIKTNIADKQAVIKSCNLDTNFIGSQVLKVNYRVSDDFKTKNNLFHPERTMEIILLRHNNDQGLPVSSYRNREYDSEVAK